MTPDDLLTRPEGKTLEFKRDFSSPDRVIRTLVAFANSAGGTVLIGVEDGTRNVVGIGESRVSSSSRLSELAFFRISSLIERTLLDDPESWPARPMLPDVAVIVYNQGAVCVQTWCSHAACRP
jgi:hypothetical protein